MEIDVLDLDWDAWNVEHCASHGVSRSDVEDICLGRREADTGHGGRLRVVGRTRRGRIVAAILDSLGDGRFYCVTAFPATGRVRREFLDRERGGRA